MAAPAPPAPRRAAAWLLTGPLGHLAGGVADWAEIAWRLARPRQLVARALRRGR